MNKCDICKYKDCTRKETKERRATCEEEGLFKRDVSDFETVKTKELINQSKEEERSYSREDLIMPTINSLVLMSLISGEMRPSEKIERMANSIIDKHAHKNSYSATEYMAVANKIMKDLDDLFE